MAISRDKKQALVSEFAAALGASKMTVAARYGGINVAELQQLRRSAREADVSIKVIKNRLVRVAMTQTPSHAASDTSLLDGQLLYALSESDEVAPAQVLAAFARTHESMQLVAGYDAAGTALDTAAVRALAELPTKDQLRGMVVSTIAAPLSQMLGVLNGAQRGFAQVLSQHAENLSA